MWRVKQVGEAKALATGLATRPAARLALALVGFTGPLACAVLLGAAVPAFADTYPLPPDNEAVVGEPEDWYQNRPHHRQHSAVAYRCHRHEADGPASEATYCDPDPQPRKQ